MGLPLPDFLIRDRIRRGERVASEQIQLTLGHPAAAILLVRLGRRALRWTGDPGHGERDLGQHAP